MLCLICALFCGAMCAAQQNLTTVEPTKLLDHLTGNWVMKGMIGGKAVTHDVDASWLLNREYLQLHEVSRERTVSGAPSYEAWFL